MSSTTYQQRRGEIETYFDRTAMAAWAKLTSTAKVSGIRATVRAGRDSMRANLLSWLPADMRGMRLLDAGCGTGALAMEVAARGADVVAIDLSPQLVALAGERAAAMACSENISFRSGDMLDPALGYFDYVVLMDAIIHYEPEDAIAALSQLCTRTSRAILFTVAPRTPILGTMLSIGKLLPRGNRSPAIVPQNIAKLRRAITGHPGFAGFTPGRGQSVKSGFYFSHAMEIKKC